MVGALFGEIVFIFVFSYLISIYILVSLVVLS